MNSPIDKKIIRFIHIPKTAGVSILNATKKSIDSLGKNAGKWNLRGGANSYHSRASERSANRGEGPTLAFLQMLESKGCKVSYKTEQVKEFKFSFVRNPWDRFVSAYVYLSEKQNDEYQEYIKPFKSFKEFVINGSIEGLHFKTQSYWLDTDLDFIGRFENLQLDFNNLLDRLLLPSQLLDHKNRTEHKPYHEYYEQQTIDCVGQKYKEDIKRFGYKFKH